ncbi:deoxyribose-phosphate aldolase [Polaribacter sp. ALD11]|uniref:deoxyribose-phosphate aldolase n=1 Tax=Polaribacter sp. ALD11 TaxID=2058137 RepID=UPI000C317601|nr:deoxyribose-phosphate aldolase [Polaribacter sp. ALD11]AUC85866.1 deoxyribose-phosphate aldolase [Polaribacter sp. ALD11]
MKINQFLDATYLKTAAQAGVSEQRNLDKVMQLVEEAIVYNYKLVMIRSNYISIVKKLLQEAKSTVLVGTVIDFPEGNASLEKKLEEAQKAILLGADELDFVVNYKAFKEGNLHLIKKEVINCISICLTNNKVAKFIIEIAALSNEEIIVISRLIKQVVLDNFGEENAKNVFVKSSTGFYKTEESIPNGATLEKMKIISKNAKPLKIKAAGGVRDYEMAIKMIALGVDRIGTSSSKEIINKEHNTNKGY